MNTEKALRAAYARQASIDSKALPKASLKREKSLNELLAEYHQQGYYLHFCFHDKTLYEPCMSCRRSKTDAKRNLESL